MDKTVEIIKDAVEHLLDSELLEENGWDKESLDILNKLAKENFKVEFIDDNKKEVVNDKKFKHLHFYRLEKLSGNNEYDYYIFIDKSKNDFKAKQIEYSCFKDIYTGEILAEDFIGSDFLEELPLTHIEQYNLSTRTYTCLRRAGINSKEELYLLWDREKLSKIRGMGEKSIKELEENGFIR